MLAAELNELNVLSANWNAINLRTKVGSEGMFSTGLERGQG